VITLSKQQASSGRQQGFLIMSRGSWIMEIQATRFDLAIGRLGTRNGPLYSSISDKAFENEFV